MIRPLLFLLILSMLISACTDVEEDLLGRQTPKQFYQTEAAFRSTTGLAYTPLLQYTSTNAHFVLQEISSDELIIPGRKGEWLGNGNWIRLHQHQYDPSDTHFRFTWEGWYRGVSVCNRLIHQFQETDSPLKERFIAEVRALRALYYSFLLDLYGNVPLITQHPAEEVSTQSRAEVFQFIEQELLASIPQLGTQVSLESYGQMHQYAAQALLAHLYLNAEIYTGTAQWQKAVEACDAIILAGIYDLSADFFSNFQVDNANSRENILSIPYDQQDAQGFNIHMASLHYASQATFQLNDQPWNGFCSLKEFYESFDSLDVRRASLLEGPQVDAEGNPLLDPLAQDPDGPQLNFTPEINDLIDTYRQAGTRINKFELAVGANSQLSNDMPVFRYAEILLNKAEALWRLNPGDAEALRLINLIRERAGVAPFGSLDAERLLAERGRELAFEAKRRTDLIRFGAFQNAWEFKAVSEPCKTLFPIPPGVVAQFGLTQNPCY